MDGPMWNKYEPGPDKPRAAWPNEPVMRPFLKVRLRADHGKIQAVKLLVDSGSEYTLINWAFARRLNLSDELKGAATDTVYIGGGTFPVSLVELSLVVGDFKPYKSIVGFIRYFDTTHAGVIGQRGCFDHFRVIFERPRMRFRLEQLNP